MDEKEKLKETVKEKIRKSARVGKVSPEDLRQELVEKIRSDVPTGMPAINSKF